jgi:hypothetical protein
VPHLLSVSGVHFPQTRDVTSITALSSQSDSCHRTRWIHDLRAQYVKN